MNSKLFRLLLVFLGLSIVYCLLGIVNVMVSLKYEIVADECVSVVTGQNLCFILNCYRLGVLVFFIVLVALSINEKKIVKPRK
ncbi:hypothetical protein [Hymenobacter sp.]|uniref:hypothetical protein n=1 Tax=Hymenobacter sp. TaxID=1898978 RepID=UPI002869FB9F|nr:hypothetical protein [Hymenobacter sp.]